MTQFPYEERYARAGKPIEVMNYERKRPTYVALLVDHPIGYCLPVGGVPSYENAICVNGMGYDISGNDKIMCLDCAAPKIKENIYT